MSILPRLTGIKPEDYLPRYVWLDEEGEQVSPVHQSLRSAISFISGWQTRWNTLIKRYGEYNLNNKSFFEKAYSPMTRSGKPPHQLKRLMVKTELVQLSEEEQIIADALLSEEFNGNN